MIRNRLLQFFHKSFIKTARRRQSAATIEQLYDLRETTIEPVQRPIRDDPRRANRATLEKVSIMKLLNIFKSFKNDESGAVTVDWVVLTAAIVGLGMVVMTTVGGGIESLSGDIVTELDATTAGYGN